MLTLLLVGGIMWLLLANVGNLDEVWEALEQVTLAQGILLVVLTLVWRFLVTSQLWASVPGLRVFQAAVASEGSAAASNAIPGPSGTVTKLAILRSWGFRTEAFANSWLFTSSLTNLVVLVAPVGIVIVLAIEGEATSGLVIAAVVGLLISATAVATVIAMLRSERFARWLGRTLGRLARWLAGVARRRPSDEDFEEATIQFRDGLVQTWFHRGGRITLAIIGAYTMLGVLFIASMRAVGFDRGIASVAELVAVYTGVRLLTLVQITPGGAGITEALYTAGLMVITGGSDQSIAVAGVILFRGLSYAGPLLLGSCALLVWRFKKSWRKRVEPEDPGVVAVTSVMIDQQPPPK